MMEKEMIHSKWSFMDFPCCEYFLSNLRQAFDSGIMVCQLSDLMADPQGVCSLLFHPVHSRFPLILLMAKARPPSLLWVAQKTPLIPAHREKLVWSVLYLITEHFLGWSQYWESMAQSQSMSSETLCVQPISQMSDNVDIYISPSLIVLHIFIKVSEYTYIACTNVIDRSQERPINGSALTFYITVVYPSGTILHTL